MCCALYNIFYDTQCHQIGENTRVHGLHAQIIQGIPTVDEACLCCTADLLPQHRQHLPTKRLSAEADRFVWSLKVTVQAEACQRPSA